jgi:hypothetical protein
MDLLSLRIIAKALTDIGFAIGSWLVARGGAGVIRGSSPAAATGVAVRPL